MMTEELTECPLCKYEKALTHYSSCGLVDWIACPKCRKFFDHGIEIKEDQGKDFWKNVEEDTGFKKVR